MIVVGCQHLKKYHAANLILEDVTFELQEGERVGLIGPNGCGKSTLLQILAGLQRQDDGQLSIQKRTRIGYLPQLPVDREDVTVYQVLALGYREVEGCRARMAELEAKMAAQDPPPSEGEMAGLLAQYAAEQERFQREGGYEMAAHIEQVARGIGLSPDWYDRPYATLSGGEKTKIGLASLLIERPTLLLLDEPTNHLDTGAIEWLESFLNGSGATCLIVSHDRYFLDRVATKIVELEDGEAFVYPTNYTGYVKEKEERLLQQFAAFNEQQKRIKQMKETIARLQEWGRVGDNVKFFRRAASMQKALDRMERVKRPVLERRVAEFDLQPSDRSGKEVLKAESLSKGYGDRRLLEQVDLKLLYGERMVLVGQNGAGKSTLFRLLLGQVAPDAGTVELGARVEVGYLAQEDRPAEAKSVLRTYCEEAQVEEGEGRSHLARFLFYGSDVFKPVHLLSGGEWTRLRLALLMLKRPNLLLLDEPTNHLDIASREALEEALEEFPGTILAISHDRYFANRIAQTIWELADGRITSYLGNYDEYREKREQLREQAAEGTTPAPAAPRPARTAGAGSQGRREERARAQLEAAIAEAEQRLAELDAAMAEAAADYAALTDRWAERERLEADLEQLYARWMEAEGAE